MNSGSCPAIERAAVPAVFRVSMKSATQSAQAPRTHPRSHALRSRRHDMMRAQRHRPDARIRERGHRCAGRRSASATAPNGRQSSAGTSGPFRSAVTHRAPPSRAHPARRRREHPVSSAMIAKVGAAARPSQWTAPRPVASTLPVRPHRSSRRVAIIVANPRPCANIGFVAVGRGNMTRQPRSYSSWRRHQGRASLRPLGARSSHWYMPQRPSSPRA